MWSFLDSFSGMATARQDQMEDWFKPRASERRYPAEDTSPLYAPSATNAAPPKAAECIRKPIEPSRRSAAARSPLRKLRLHFAWWD